jgi:nitrous-oxide reductase
MRFTRIGALSASGVAVLLTATVTMGCGPQQATQVSQSPASSTAELMKQRGLSEADVSAALQTYTPTGKKDTYLTFASGGHGGNMIVIGVPSMRILKYVGVFTPEPWQGYGYGDQSGQVLEMGSRFGKEMTWGDMHHPALSETEGDYDGQFVFVNDKANARIAVIDLHDFVTKQIVTSQLIQSDHGATFVTPNTEYVIESSQYPAPLGGGYAPIEDYQEKYRGAVIFWKFDREKGKIDPSNSFAMELPPYMQDLADAGKLASEGWVFINSFNTEMSYGGTLEGRPPLESGASQNDMDYMHIINLKAAEAVYKAGKTTKIAGMDVITLETTNKEGLLHLLGEPKSPHGMDVTPDGKELVVSGKLDTHGTVYEFAKIKALIDAKKYAGKDQYGVPILPFEDSIRGQVEIGLGPLHTQFDDKGNAYTSVFIESTVAKWSLKDLKLIEKIKVHYNVGHIVAAEGDTVSPDGGYLIAMDKWALDRFNKVGPLLPQNFQLININSEPMQLLYDMPLPLGEPHYAQMIKADKINPVDVYKPAGYDVVTDEHSPYAVKAKEERIEREGKNVHVYMTSVRSHFTPDIIRVKLGDTVHLHITNVEQAHDATHGFTIGSYNVHSSLEPGKHVDITFKADRAGTFPFYCTEFCSALHLEMAGYLLVEPS